MTRTPLLGPHEGPMRPSLTHLRPLSAAISAFRCKAGREPALGAAIYRFSRAVRAPPTIQTNRKPSRPLHPSPVRQRTTRLRAAPPSSTPSRSLPCPCRRRCARRYRALALDVPSNGVRERAWRKGKGRGEAWSRSVLRGNPIGRRFPRKSRLALRRHPPCLTRLLEALYRNEFGRTFDFIELLGRG